MDLDKIIGFRKITAKRIDDSDGTTLFNILGDTGPVKHFSIGGMRCETPKEDVRSFYVAREEPPATLLVSEEKIFWLDAYDIDWNATLSGRGFPRLEPTKPCFA